MTNRIKYPNDNYKYVIEVNFPVPNVCLVLKYTSLSIPLYVEVPFFIVLITSLISLEYCLLIFIVLSYHF